MPNCPLCGKYSLRGETHEKCTPRTLFYTHSIAVFDYTKVIKRLFAAYKYKQAFQYQRVIEDLLTEYVKNDPFLLIKTAIRPTIVLLPVPMTERKQEDRGFSPAYEIAVILGRLFRAKFAINAKICVGLVSKVGDVTSQARKDRRQRLLSLQKEYQRVELKVEDFIQQPIDVFIIVDDVVTTGATTTAVIEAIAKSNLLAEKLRKIPVVRFSFARA